MPARYLQADGGRLYGGWLMYAWDLAANAEHDAPGYTYFLGSWSSSATDYHWSYAGPDQVVRRKCHRSGGGFISILNREPVAGECIKYIRRAWTLYTASTDLLYVLEDWSNWSEDPTLGHPPVTRIRTAQFFKRTPF